MYEQVEIAILTVIPPELEAAREVLRLKRSQKAPDGTNYWIGEVSSHRSQRKYRVALACIGQAGNYNSATETATLIQNFEPKIVILVGIAAGIRGENKIGEVLFSERVVGYESAALGPNGTEIPRPEMPRIRHTIAQDVVNYQSTKRAARLQRVFTQRLMGTFPIPPEAAEQENRANDFREHVACELTVKVATIASGEKLLRDGSKLSNIRKSVHGRTGAGEMEAIGLATACERLDTDWLVIRGISDFGDEFKDERFHEFASKAAAAVLLDFIQYGLCLDSQDRSSSPKAPRRNRAAGRQTESTSITNRSRTDVGQSAKSKPVLESENRAQLVDAKAANYRDTMLHLERACSLKKLLGISPLPGSPNINITDIFVPQQLRAFDPPRHSGDKGVVSMPGAPQGDRARDLSEVLNENRWLLLLGEPGLGKTTLSRWLLVRLSEPSAFLPCLKDMTPVRIDLEHFDRQYWKHIARDAYTFFDHISGCNRELSIDLMGAEVELLAQKGQVFWIFDGMDEVARFENREKYCQMIAGLLRKYKSCRGIITSRLEGSRSIRAPLENAGFRSYRIEKFTPAQRERLLNSLCSTLFQGNAEAEHRIRDRIAEALAGRHSLRELAEVPLYCSLLVSIGQDEPLPLTQRDLLQSIVDRLEFRWAETSDPTSKIPTFSSTRKWRFLRDLAHKIFVAGASIRRGDLHGFVADFLRSQFGLEREETRVVGSLLVDQLPDVCGMIAKDSEATYSFTHRVFLEYLTASHFANVFLCDNSALDELNTVFTTKWKDPSWSEVLQFLCGILSTQNPDCVVRLLQRIIEDEPGLVYEDLDGYVSFCIRSLSEFGSLDNGLVLNFIGAINDLLAHLVQKWAVNWSSLADSFQRVSGRWPQIEKLIDATEVAFQNGRTWLDEAYVCWLTAAGLNRRIVVLEGALKWKDVAPWPVLLAAGKLGAWSNEEIRRILKATEHRDELSRFNVAATIVTTEGMTWIGTEPVVEILSNYTETAIDSDIQMRSAAVLVKIGCLKETAWNRLCGFLTSDKQPLSVDSAIWLAELGHPETAMSVFAKYAHEDARCMARLARLSAESQEAQEGLEQAFTRLRSEVAPDNFVRFAAKLGWYDPSLLTWEEIVVRLRLIENTHLRLIRLDDFTLVPAWRHSAYTEFQREYQQAGSDQDRHFVKDQVYSGDLVEGGEALLALFREMLQSDDPRISIPVAGKILKETSDPSLKSRSHRFLVQFARKEFPDEIRLLAARNLGIGDITGRAIHSDLAREAGREVDRLSAARFTGDLNTLHELAITARDEHWRNQAKLAIETYQHILAVAEVGRKLDKDGSAARASLRVGDIKGRVHVAIITVRPDEYDAMEARLGNTTEVDGGNNSYQHAEIDTSSGARLSVVLTRVVAQGNTPAQAVASNVIHELDPAWLLLVGIAGGVPDTEFSLGDVIVASYLNDFSLTAAIEGKNTTHQTYGGRMHPAVERFLQTKIVGKNRQRLIELAGFGNDSSFQTHPNVAMTNSAGESNLYGEEEFRKKVQHNLECSFPDGIRVGPPRIWPGPCANGNVLVKDTKLLHEWQNSARQIVHVETELAGVYEAAHSVGRQNYPLLAVRGLSDVIGFKRDPGWTEYACRTAAAFADAVLRSGFINFGANLPPSTP